MLSSLVLLSVFAGQQQTGDPAVTRVEVFINEDLDRLKVSLTSRSTNSPTRIRLPSQKYKSFIRGQTNATYESTILRQLYPYGWQPGGFEVFEAKLNHDECKLDLGDFAESTHLASCPGDGILTIEGEMVVPHRAGPFGTSDSQLTLGGYWMPQIIKTSTSTMCEVLIHVPDDTFLLSPKANLKTKTSSGTVFRANYACHAAEMPLIVRRGEPEVETFEGGAVRLIHDDRAKLELRAFRGAFEKAVSLLEELGWWSPESSIQFIDVDLQHMLAYSVEGASLVSRRAFRVLPLERIERFHELEVVRVFFSHYFREVKGRTRQTAEVLGTWLQELYVRKHFRARDDASDFLGIWRFVPMIDAMITSPDLPFASSYFRRVAKPDPNAEEFTKEPRQTQKGQVVYHKILDRLGFDRSSDFLRKVGQGYSLEMGVEEVLGNDFIQDWFGPLPKLQYSLGKITQQPSRVEIQIIREGDQAAEPIELRLIDNSGESSLHLVPSSVAAIRTYTATTVQPIEEVILDPRGRLLETATASKPSPLWYNRTHPIWRVVVNYFELQFSATDGEFSSSADLRLYREHDPHWRFGLNASITPSTYSASLRSSYSFGRKIQENRLEQWFGLLGFADRLRASFAGAGSASTGVGARLFYRLDNRRSLWAPSPGQAVRLGVEYRRDLSQSSFDNDTMQLTARGVQEWLFESGQGLSMKLAWDQFLMGTPQLQKLLALGGRQLMRGYSIQHRFGRARGLASLEWRHPIFQQMNINLGYLLWLDSMDGGLFADASILVDEFQQSQIFDLENHFFDVGYSFKLYFDWFGVQPSVMMIDLGWPIKPFLRGETPWSPTVYIGFEQSFFIF
ncbi:MAG: hypothetical protein VYC39_17425 [Myxococcota bacterium]|nr:hypothetical protein [Myxococcota bacterium]